MFDTDQILNWRSENRYWAKKTLESAFPALILAVEAEIETATLRNVTTGRKSFLHGRINPLVERWQRKQLARLRYRLESTLTILVQEASFSPQTSDSEISDNLISGADMLAAASPLVALPVLGSAFTFGSTWLVLGAATVSVSWPLVAVGVGVLATATASSKTGRRKLATYQKNKLAAALQRELRDQLISTTSDARERPQPSFLTAVLSDIDNIARAKTEIGF